MPSDTSLLLSPWPLFLALPTAAEWVIVFLAGAVRGFTGFGFAMVAVTGLSALRPPAEVVPAVLVLELAAALHLLPRTWREVEWKSVSWLVAGAGVGVLPGVLFLALAPAAVVRMWVSAAVCAAAVTLARGWTLRRAPGRAATFAVGAASGILNSSAAIGGPPVILFYLGTRGTAETTRASLIAYFTAIDACSLIAMLAAGLLRGSVVRNGLLWLLPAWAGVIVGERLFARHAHTARYRSLAILLLGILGAAGLTRAAFELAR